MTHARLHSYAGGLTLLVIALALLNWNIAPERSNSWIAAMGTMPVIWLMAGLKMKMTSRVKLSETEEKFFNATVIFAGLIMAFTLSAKFVGKTYGLDPSFVERARNVSTGFAVLFFANMIPKLIGPPLSEKCSKPSANSVRRFTGWALALGAIGFMGAWMFAPISSASTLSHISLGTAVVLVILRVLLALVKDRKPSR